MRANEVIKTPKMTAIKLKRRLEQNGANSIVKAIVKNDDDKPAHGELAYLLPPVNTVSIP